MKHFRLIRLFAVVTAMMCALGIQAQEAYAVVSEDFSKLTFYYDTQRDSRPGVTYSIDSECGWSYWASFISKVVFDPSFAGARPTSTADWFRNIYRIKSITGLSYLNTSEVTNMKGMFRECSGLKSLDLSHFNTSNVINMDSMFFSCSSLTNLNLSHFNTSNVTSMKFMFSDCNNLTSLNLSSFNTSNVTNMGYMFKSCRELNSLDLSNFNTANVSDMREMFANCIGLTSLNLTSFNTANVTNMSSMFLFCSGLTRLDLSSFNTANVTNMSDMFSNCSSLKRFDISNFNTANVTNMNYMFAGCNNLEVIEINHFNTSKLKSLDGMFQECKTITSLDLSSFNTENVTSVNYMFENCENLVTIYVSDLWNMDKVLGNIFNSPCSLSMFEGCLSLVGEQGTTYDANRVNVARAHVDGGPSYPGYLSYKEAPAWTSHFEKDGIYYNIMGGPNTVWVTYKDENYNSYSGEVTIPSTVTYGGETYTVKAIDNRTFRNCTGLTKVTIPATVNNIGYTAFDNCPSLQTIVCQATTPPRAFESSFSSYSATLYVPRGSVENYADAPYWSNFTNILELGGNQVFEYNGLYYSITGAYTVMVTYKNTNYNSYSGEVTIPETVTYDGTTYNVTAIGTRAFYNCTGLTAVTIGSNVTAIGDEAFRNCTNLGTNWGWYLTIPDGVTTIGYSAFRNCNRIGRVDLGSGVSFIDNVAFDCEGLYTVVCTSPVPPRTDDAFTTINYTYTDVYVPVGARQAYQNYYEWSHFNRLHSRYNYDFEVDSIYYEIQADSTSVHVVHKYDGVEDVTYPYSEQKYNIPETVSRGCDTYTVTGIGRSAFWECSNLEHVSLPKTIQEIGDMAFRYCPSLESVYCHAMTVPTLSEYAFDERAYNEVTVMVPYSVYYTYAEADVWQNLGCLDALPYHFEKDGFYYYIGENDKAYVAPKEDQFNEMTYQGDITIPETVTYEGTTYNVSGIAASAFWNCTNLTGVNMGRHVGSIDSGAFAGCTSLTEVTIPASVLMIESQTFYNCTGLKRVTIPEDVWNVSYSAFSGCTGLEDIYCYAETPPTVYTNTFSSYDATLHVPYYCRNSYMSKNYWKNFNIVAMPSLNEALNVVEDALYFECAEYPWRVVEEGDRTYAISMNYGVPNSESSLYGYVDVPEGGGTLSFLFKAWGEGDDSEADDYCMFLIDNEPQFSYGAYQNDWETSICDLSAGEHTLEWRYSKNGSVNPEGDYFAVDSVQLITAEVSLDQALNVAGGTIHFDSDGNFPWIVQNEDDRVYAMSGNAGARNSASVLTATVTVDKLSALSFDFKAWGETRASYIVNDSCVFYVDGVRQFRYGARDNDWEAYTVVLTPGEHTLMWGYFKNGTINPVGDYFAVDNVQIAEVSLDQALNVDDGTIHFICYGVHPWTVQSEDDRVFAMSGNAGAQSSFSGIRAEVTAEEGDILTFDFKAWGQSRGELVKDACIFSIDGVTQFKYGARDNDWETHTVVLEAGEHTLTWVYSKDEFFDPTGDYFAVDNVQIVAGPTYTRGDVDGDGNVGIGDVTSLIDFLLNGASPGVTVTSADTDLDGKASIGDVTALIDYLLNGVWPMRTY